MSAETPLAVELRAITKSFGPLVANKNISLAVRPGEVHAIVDKSDRAERGSEVSEARRARGSFSDERADV